jgi:hypothetical protein
MLRLRIPTLRLLAMLGLMLVLSATAYGFAAANTVPESGAGDGQNTISGYDITNVTYTLNSTTPSNLATVAFDIAPTAGASAPSTVKVKLVSASSTWFACSNTATTNWSCTITGVTATQADELRVVAAQ